MADRPILFSAPMVRALLEGRKTQTRRLAWSKRRPSLSSRVQYSRRWDGSSVWQHVKPGDRLWVRETFVAVPCGAGQVMLVYRASCPNDQFRHVDFDTSTVSELQVERWTSPIHMPREASRLTLEVTATKMERVQDISHDDAKAEGLHTNGDKFWWDEKGERFGYFAVDVFADLWRSLHGPESWDANPEVVALTFTVHKANIDG